jgi:molybdate transport system substrate-binding protein
MRSLFVAATSVGAMILLSLGFVVEAAEIRIIAADPLTTLFNELGPQFERQTGHKLVLQFDVVPVIKRKIEAGHSFDLAISTLAGINDLINADKIVASTRADFAYSGIGVAVRAGARKPDLSSVDTFKRALLDARSVAYSPEGPTGIHLASVLQRLGIAEEMKAKTKLQEGGARVARAVADGEAELGFTAMSTILLARGAEVAGPFPAELQSYVVFTAGIGTGAKEAGAAKALMTFITGPEAAPVIKAKGLEPGAPR